MALAYVLALLIIRPTIAHPPYLCKLLQKRYILNTRDIKTKYTVIIIIEIVIGHWHYVFDYIEAL